MKCQVRSSRDTSNKCTSMMCRLLKKPCNCFTNRIQTSMRKLGWSCARSLARVHTFVRWLDRWFSTSRSRISLRLAEQLTNSYGTKSCCKRGMLAITWVSVREPRLSMKISLTWCLLLLITNHLLLKKALVRYRNSKYLTVPEGINRPNDKL